MFRRNADDDARIVIMAVRPTHMDAIEYVADAWGMMYGGDSWGVNGYEIDYSVN